MSPKNKKKPLKNRMAETSIALFEHVKTKAELYVSIFALVGSIFGGYFYINNTYVLASDQKVKDSAIEQRQQTTDNRLEQKILGDKLMAIESHMWAIEDHYKNIDKAPSDTKQEYRDLGSLKDRIKSRLEVLDKSLGIYGN